MKAMIRRLARSIFLLFVATSARAQTNPPTNKAEGLWVEVGAGVGKSASAKGNAAVSGAVEWQRGHQLWSVRGDAVSTSWSSSVAQVALLLGRATVDSNARFGGASAGLGFVHSTACIRNCGLFSSGPATQTARDGLGVSVAVTGALRAGRRGGVGIGITPFANINSLSSFVGVSVGVSGGRWR